jgi:ABC-type transport system substrate-binding protein
MGWIDTDADGVRESHGVVGIPDGTLLAFTLVTTDSPERTQVGTLIVEELKSCGMKVGIKQSPPRELLAQNPSSLLSGRNFEIALTSSEMNMESICGLAITDEISSEQNGWSGSNLGGYSIPSLDTACAQMQTYLPGSDEYLTFSQTAIRLFSEAIPIFPLFYFSGFTLARSDLNGIQTGFSQFSELQNIESFQFDN